MSDKFDVCVIGAGVVGCAVARELSRYELSVCVVEKEEDVCSGTSKANSGIVHSGYDAKPGSMKALMNVRGSALVKELSEKLDFHYRQNGSMVLCFEEESIPVLHELFERGVENGVAGLSVITGGEARKIEPAVSEKAVAALLAPTGGIVCPFGMTIAFAENAASNGVEFRFLNEVEDITRNERGYTLKTSASEISARYIVNAAGVFADIFHNMVSEDKINITPRRGEYVLFDREVGNTVDHTIFQLPGKKGKGVLVTPTVHGNLLAGPNAEDIDDKEATETTSDGTSDIKRRALESVPSLPYGRVITGFAGLRAHEDCGDFIIGEVPDAPGFFDAAGIESPGLTSAPAIGEYLAGKIAEASGAGLKEHFIDTRKAIPEISKLPPEERTEMIRKNPAYGRIVCRCESISEGEIIDAIHRKPGAVSMDGIKRRVRQGMGRCQAGFCTPFAMEILSRELGIPMAQIAKNRPGSEQIVE